MQPSTSLKPSESPAGEPGANTRPLLIWKTYGVWAFWVGVAFFSVYPLCNWITAQRDPSSLWRFFTQAELRAPLAPQFIWIYLSMYALFFTPPFFLDVQALRLLGKRLIAGTLLAGAIFLLFPSQLGFVRWAPAGSLEEAAFERMFSLDLPYNNLPSLHVVFSALIACALARSASSRALRSLAYAWLALICCSTLLVHQHHLADIAAGLALAALLQVRWSDSIFTRRKTCSGNPSTSSP